MSNVRPYSFPGTIPQRPTASPEGVPSTGLGQTPGRPAVYLALGANVPGAWGTASQSLMEALSQLSRRGIHVIHRSSFYQTKAQGPRQPAYLNLVIQVRSPLPPLALLGVLKGLERDAGRRRGPRWGPRPLDIDILAYGYRICGWNRRASGLRPLSPDQPGPPIQPLILPHPRMSRRNFVLVPLGEIAGAWYQPAVGLRPRQSFRKLPFSLQSGLTCLDI